MEHISKTVFLNYLKCPTLGWKTKRAVFPKFSGLDNELLNLESRNIHKAALKLFPDAVNWKVVKAAKHDAAYKNLFAGLDTGKAVYAVSFTADGFYAKPDILKKLENNSWHLFGIKSGNRCKVKYVNDISFDAMVLSKLGIKVSIASILYLSDNYRIGIESSKAFNEADCSEKVKLKAQEFSSIASDVLKGVENDVMPEPSLKRCCKNCTVFYDCIGKGVKNHIFDLPRLSILQMDELVKMCADTIDKIPDDFELSESQKIAKNCVLANSRYISTDLKDRLDAIKFPFYYLDFEFMTTIMPLYPNIAPRTHILTQFSLDKTDKYGNILDHYEYIADQTRDCRKDIAEKLIEYLDGTGSIVTYADAERAIISELAVMFPELSDPLNKIVKRIVDLELIIKECYYDINFRGKTSMKKILPVLIPDMNYDSLTIHRGSDASAAFAFMAMGMYDENKITETKNNLLKYCAQDTLAMIYVHQFLINVVVK
ncbi:MAG: DUF2779 domain-containing protein [Endomicrobium sp.]|jgi:hypothetical protein|nr:DUF2779 domain-containing protein [Endomicrobium sp.]